MIAYSSYLDADHSLPVASGAIVVVNTVVALLAGFLVFPVLFAIGVEPGTGELGAAFVPLSGALGRIPGGAAVGTAFLAGVPSALGADILGRYNVIVFQLSIPLAVLLSVVFVGWVGKKKFTDKVSRGSTVGGTFTVAWIWWVHIVIALAVTFTLALGVQLLLVRAGLLESALVPG
jgi:NSS family neurotransmitter:Na+ symporter